MQSQTNGNTASIQFRSMEHSRHAIDFSSGTSSQHYIQYESEILDLRVRRPNETSVKQECHSPLSSPVINVNHDETITSASHRTVSYTHVPLPTNVVPVYPQPPNTVSQPSEPISPLFVSNTIPAPSSSVISVQPIPIPSDSTASPPVTYIPQQMLYYRTPPSPTEDPSKLQLAPSPESMNSNNSDTSSIPALSPTSLGLQSSPFSLLHPGNPLAPLTVPSSVLVNQSKKCPRPFKAISLSLGEANATSDEAYMEYRRNVLETVQAVTKSGGNKKNRTSTKRPTSPQPSSSSEGNPPDEKDDVYREKRKKNNEAAKRSRDARRRKEDELAIRTTFLERENLMLKYEVMQYRSCGLQLVPSTCMSNS